MRMILVYSILLLTSATVTLAQEGDPESDVRAAVSAFAEAFLEVDVAALEGLLTDDYVHVNGRSGNVLHREEWLNWISSRREELDTGALVISSYKIEDVTVDLYGETAVVTAEAHAEGVRNGDAYQSHVRMTNVWVRIEGVWRRAAFHDSALPEGGE